MLKNSLFYKYILKNLIFLILFLFAYGIGNAATIESTTTGGSWYDTNTWVDGVVPLDGDDVIINGNI